MVKLIIFAIVFASVLLKGGLGGVVDIKSSSDIEQELSSMRENDIANLKSKSLMFSEFCLSIFNDSLNQLEQVEDGNSSSLSELERNKIKESIIVNYKIYDRLIRELENSRSSLEIKLQESSNYARSSLEVALNLFKANPGNKAATQEEVNFFSDPEVAFRSLETRSWFEKQYEKEVKERFEEIKSKIIIQDASMSEIKLEDLNCKSWKRAMNTKIVFKFFADNEEAIKVLLRKDLQKLSNQD